MNHELKLGDFTKTPLFQMAILHNPIDWLTESTYGTDPIIMQGNRTHNISVTVKIPEKDESDKMRGKHRLFHDIESDDECHWCFRLILGDLVTIGNNTILPMPYDSSIVGVITTIDHITGEATLSIRE